MFENVPWISYVCAVPIVVAILAMAWSCCAIGRVADERAERIVRDELKDTHRV